MSGFDNNYLISNYGHADKSASKQMTKRFETRQSFFEKNPEQSTEIEVSQYSNASQKYKRQNRQKSTHSSKSKREILLRIQRERIEERLVEENKELKRTIAQLKMNELYKIDENKIKSMLLQIDQLKQKIKVLAKQNQMLRLENDFYWRTNVELKKWNQNDCKVKNVLGANEIQMLERERDRDWGYGKEKINKFSLNKECSQKFSLSKQKLDPYKIKSVKKKGDQLSCVSGVKSDKILVGVKRQSKNKMKIRNTQQVQDYLSFQ